MSVILAPGVVNSDDIVMLELRHPACATEKAIPGALVVDTPASEHLHRDRTECCAVVSLPDGTEATGTEYIDEAISIGKPIAGRQHRAAAQLSLDLQDLGIE